MFTGIVEKTVKVLEVADKPGLRRLTLASDWPDVQCGQSVAVNGCCLTVAGLSPGRIAFDVITETLSKTNLGLLKPGDAVNVERSMAVGQRIDGHFVQGHVDATGELVQQISTAEEWRLTIRIPDAIRKYMIPKGSVSVDGVSLTIAALTRDTFDVALIPTTLKLTTLGTRPAGWPFNLEADVISKTIVTYLEARGV